MKIVVVNGKEYKLPKRYQDKRAVEKLISKARNAPKKKPKKKARPEEVKIPFQLDHRTIVYIRESRFLAPKWLQYFDSEEAAIKYIENFKRVNNETENISVPSNGQPNRTASSSTNLSSSR